MKSVAVRMAVMIGLFGLAGCYSPSTAYKDEFGGFSMPGRQDVSTMSPRELHAAIEVAYLDGELTAEQARKAHYQLDVKGHLTAEQIAVINRERLAKRDAYETRKEELDVVRDTFGSGRSVLNDVNAMKDTLRSIFH